jgi:ketosteroid isomerase-like protein
VGSRGITDDLAGYRKLRGAELAEGMRHAIDFGEIGSVMTSPIDLVPARPRVSIGKEITMSKDNNVAIAQQLLAGIGEGRDPEVLARLFAEDLRFEIQGDEGVLPWIGHKTGRGAAADFFRKLRVLTEPVKFEVEDILASEGRAAIVGELATRIKSSGKVCTSQFAIILTISGDAITRFQMLEDSFGLSKAVQS